MIKNFFGMRAIQRILTATQFEVFWAFWAFGLKSLGMEAYLRI